MGALLDKPETNKEQCEGEGNGIRYEVCSMQGWRNTMEDSHCAKIGLDGLKDWSFFAVFDGHAGEGVSKYCADKLLEAILESEDFKKSVTAEEFNEEQIELAKKGIKNGFLKLDKKMKDLPEMIEKKDKSGSTAVCCLISPKHYFFINCGDSRALLSSNGQVKFNTNDHKPYNIIEKERIQNAGGSVMLQRINGSLAVSRALGDYEYKSNEKKTDCEQLVSPEPEINVIERNDKEDEFILICCDGIFDVVSNDDLCTYTRYLYEVSPEDSKITYHLLDYCLFKGSLDNMTVCLVTLPAHPKRNNEKAELDKQLEEDILKEIKLALDSICNEENREFDEVMNCLENKTFNNLPPAVGLDAKKKFIAEKYSEITDKPIPYNQNYRGW